MTEGKILFQGKNILELDETSLQKLRGTEIAMIFQDVGASLDPIRIVESQYRESILAHRKMAKADCRSLEKEMLAKMHLTDPERVMVSYPFELSGGMARRVLIGTAVVEQPQLVIADEPFLFSCFFRFFCFLIHLYVFHLHRRLLSTFFPHFPAFSFYAFPAFFFMIIF